MKNYLIAAVVFLIVLIGGYFVLQNYPAQAPAENISGNTYQGPPRQQTEPPLVPALQTTSEEHVVNYTSSGFSPQTIDIKSGDTVIFKNQSSINVWPASAVHPTHAVYPTAGGCIGSTFDACKGISPGNSWSFKFETKGSWKYHNHLNPGQNGTVVVQ